MALCHNEQTASLPLNSGFGHVRQYTPFILNFRGQRIFPVDEGENFMGTKFLCKFALL